MKEIFIAMDHQSFGAKILYVDDDVLLRTTIPLLLNKHGFTVITAADGQEGVEVAREWRPDLILMDLMMPVMDGYQAAAALRAHPDTSETPIIAFSAFAGENTRREVKIKGMNGLISKETLFPEIVRVLRSHLTS